jgi:hypothetical protein
MSGAASADNHSIAFKQRQASTPMKITSVQITPNAGSISAEGSMVEYGQTYVTYNLTPDANGKGGLVLAEGRGALKKWEIRHWVWRRFLLSRRHKVRYAYLFRINDGTQNLDKVVFDAASRSLTHDVYIAK